MVPLITAGHPGPKADSLIAVLATNSGTTNATFGTKKLGKVKTFLHGASWPAHYG